MVPWSVEWVSKIEYEPYIINKIVSYYILRKTKDFHPHIMYVAEYNGNTVSETNHRRNANTLKKQFEDDIMKMSFEFKRIYIIS